MTANEEWKNFPMIHGMSFSKYEASSLGRIRNKKTGYIFSSKPDSAGYVRSDFVDDEGKRKSLGVHIIVARAFIGEPTSDDFTPDHINRDRADNQAFNLRWATRKQQVANSDKSKRGRLGQSVIQYTMDMEEIKRWPTINSAANELGIFQNGIGLACRGKLNQTGGYKWAYERQDLDGEIWKNHKSMNVQVSNMGRIKTPHYHIAYGSKTRDGYMKYGESDKLVHIIVAEAFLPNPKKKLEVNHKDKNGTNNKVENLEWVTRSENIIHSHKNSSPDRYNRTSRAVKQYDLKGNFIGEYRSQREASRQTECSGSAISQVCLGIAKSTKGFVFKYSNEDVLNPRVKSCPKKVDLIDKKGNIIEVYNSTRAAALDLEIPCGSIYTMLCGTAKKTKGGYRFQYH
uniref:HNH endonuclease n=1 Tax=Marseillevirus LCMAC101 TaxID=2506602 RepID=A0A481YTJ9_9VIRU|nr:MAG: HNH endonuclease [Marseillevirus LCMAC101]